MSNFIEYIFHSNIINLLAVVAILIWIVKKFDLVSAVDKKIDDIKLLIIRAEQQREAAISELKNVKNQVKNIESEKSSLKCEAGKTAQTYKEKIAEETQQALQEIERNTDKFLEAEQKSLKEAVSREIAEDALEIAKEHIKHAINDDMHKKYINDFIDNLDEMKV